MAKMEDVRMPLDDIIELGYKMLDHKMDFGVPAPEQRDRLDIDEGLEKFYGGGLVCLGLMVQTLLEMDLLVMCDELDCANLLDHSCNSVWCAEHDPLLESQVTGVAMLSPEEAIDAYTRLGRAQMDQSVRRKGDD